MCPGRFLKESNLIHLERRGQAGVPDKVPQVKNPYSRDQPRIGSCCSLSRACCCICKLESQGWVTSVVHMHCSSSCHVAVQKLRQSHTSPPAGTAPRHRRAGLLPRALCFAGSSCHKCPQQLVCHRHMGRLCHLAAAQHDPRPSSSTLLTDAIYPPGKRFCPSLALCPRSRGRQSVKVCGPCRTDVGRDSVRLVCFCVSSLTKVPQT